MAIETGYEAKVLTPAEKQPMYGEITNRNPGNSPMCRPPWCSPTPMCLVCGRDGGESIGKISELEEVL